MHKFWLLSILAISIWSTGVGQEHTNHTVNWGKSVEGKANDREFLIHSSAGGHLSYNLLYKGKITQTAKQVWGEERYQFATGCVIEQYDHEMKRTKSVKFPIAFKGKTRFVEKIMHLNGHIVVFTSFHNRYKKFNYLFIETLNPQTLRSNKDMKKIAEFPVRSKFNLGKYKLLTSPDSTKILIYYELPRKQNGPKRIGTVVIDDDLDIQFQKDIELPYTDNEFFIDRYHLSNLGRVYVAGRLAASPVRTLKIDGPGAAHHGLLQAKIPFSYLIMEFDEVGEPREHKIELPDGYIYDCTFRSLPSGNLICAGFYSDRESYSFRGAFYFNLNVYSGEIQQMNQKPFSDEFISSMKGKKREKSGRELQNFSLDEIIIKPDGQTILIAEKFYTYFATEYVRSNLDARSNSWRSATVLRYAYLDLLVVGFDESGTIDWTVKIPKSQVSNNGSKYDSYAYAMNGNELYILYNDHIDNLKKQSSRRRKRTKNFTSGQKRVSTLVHIDPEGQMYKSALKDQGVMAQPQSSQQAANGQLLVFGEKETSHLWGRLILD